MRNRVLFTLIAVCLSAFAVLAQAPNGLQYQAIARDASGNILSNQNINLRISIVDSASNGALVFQENHKLQTNQFGLFSINIGDGFTLIGGLGAIQWSTGNKWIQIEMDPSGGTNFAFMGRSQLLSVPYALYAESVGGVFIADTSATNETITSVTFNPATDELIVSEAGLDYITTIDYRADELGDNVLNDLSDVNTIPTAGQILRWNGLNWEATDDDVNNQNLAIIAGDQLSITDGNTVDLSPYVNTDDQVLNYDPNTGILGLEDGGSVNLSGLSSAGFNDNLDFNPTNDELTITDDGGSFTVDLTVLRDDADADPTNEFNTAFAYDANTNLLTITDAGNSYTADLSVLATGSFNTGFTFDPNTNTLTISDNGTSLDVNLNDLVSDAYNTGLGFDANTNVLTITDGGNTLSVNLASLSADADADPANEFNSALSFDGNTNQLSITDGGNTLTTDLSPLIQASYNTNVAFDPNTNILTVTDGGGSFDVNLSTIANDAYNNNFTFNALTRDLSIEDNGNTFTVNLSSLINDPDSDPTNEIQTLGYNAGILSLSGTATTVNLSGLTGTDNQGLSSNNNGTSTVTVDITNGTGTTFSIEDADADAANELQDLSLSGNTLSLTNDPSSVDLSSFLDNTDNQGLSNTVIGTNVTINISNGAGTTFSVADNDNSATNEIQTLGQVLTVGNNAGGTKITNLGTPTAGSDAATKSYVDAQVGALTGFVEDRAVNNNFGSGQAASMDITGSAEIGGSLEVSGNVALGSTNPSGYKLFVNGRIKTTGINEISDARYKTNIQRIGSAMDKVRLLEGVVYEWNTKKFKDMDFEEGLQMGLIAQEVEKVIPEVVKTDVDGYKAVEYSHLVALLIEAIKEQDKMLSEKDAEIAALKAEFEANKQSQDVTNAELEHKIEQLFLIIGNDKDMSSSTEK